MLKNRFPVQSIQLPLKTSHWFKENCIHFPKLENQTHFDVAVIGGGFAGLSSAIRLKELSPHKRIAIIEAKHLGFGASGRSGGWVEAFPPLYWLSDDLTNKSLRDDFGFAIQTSQIYMRNFSDAVAGEFNPADWKISKHHLLARNLIERATLRWLKSRLDTLRMANDYNEYDKSLSNVGYATTAKLTWDCICIDPYKAIQYLQKRCLQLGIEIYEDSLVNEIDHHKFPIALKLQNDVPITAEKLVIATNAYTHQIKLTDKRPFTYIRHTYMISTVPIDNDVIEKISVGAQPFGDPVHSYYSGRFHNNRFLFNGNDSSSQASEKDDRRVDAYLNLIHECHRRFPFLRDIAIESAWGGPTLQTGSDAPLIKKSDVNPNMIYNIGFGGGSGICRALQSGRLVGALVFPELTKDISDAERLRQIWTLSRFPILGPLRTVGGVLHQLMRK